MFTVRTSDASLKDEAPFCRVTVDVDAEDNSGPDVGGFVGDFDRVDAVERGCCDVVWRCGFFFGGSIGDTAVEATGVGVDDAGTDWR